MTIKLMGSDFNRIMKVCAPCISREELRPPLRNIIVECDGQGNGCATALDGFKMTQLRFKCAGDRGKLFVWPFKKVNEDKEITISCADGVVSVSDGDETISRKMLSADTYVDHAKLFADAIRKEKVVQVSFNPHHLMTLLKAMPEKANSLITLEIGDPVNPVILKSDDASGMVCPMRVHYKYESPVAWELKADG